MQAILLLMVCVIGYSHPFHISICDIEHDQESRSLQITSRLFLDDFELALARDGKPDAFFQKSPESEINQELKLFFETHLKVSVDSKPLDHQYLGFEIEDNVVWCYLEIEDVKSFNEISVQYSVLLDTFRDQINLAHVRYQGMVKSLKFQQNQLTGTAAFTN